MNRFSLSSAFVGFAIVSPFAMVAPAAAQVDAAAKTLLQDASIAISNLKGVTFKSKRTLDGMQGFNVGGDADVKFIRNPGAPSASMFYAKGTQFKGTEKVNIEGGFDGQLSTWVDEAAKTIRERRTTAGDSKDKDGRVVKDIRDQQIPDNFFEVTPFDKELRAEKIAFEPDATVGGVKCKVVRTTFTNKRENLFFIAETDKLPRRIQQFSDLGNGKIARNIEITDVVLVPTLTAEGLRIPERTGFQRIAAPVVQPPTPPVKTPQNQIDPNQAVSPTNPNPSNDPNKPVPPQPQPQTPPAPPRGGLNAGTVAPGFELDNAAGGRVGLSSLQGKVTVLTFFNSKVNASGKSLAAVQEAISKTPGVEGLAIASKDPNTEAAKKFLADNKVGMLLLLGGERISDSYKLRGFPSVVVIGKDGKVAATIENGSAEEISSAISAAAK